MSKISKNSKIFVVIPCYKTLNHISEVIKKIDKTVSKIVIVDDQCPENTGLFVKENFTDSRIVVLFNRKNLGVGGATIVGYRYALLNKADVIVKIDGDGQMNPALIKQFVEPIKYGKYDYVKGNRFWNIDDLKQMPKIRLFGNLTLSFIAKASTGYWNLFDPNNGFTAVSSKVLAALPLDKLEKRFFFESDILFRLNLESVKVGQISMTAVYGNEKSNLRVYKILPEFIYKHLRNFIKRLVYVYYLRDFSIASLNLLLGLALFGFGLGLGIETLLTTYMTELETSTGTQILIAMTFLSGLNMLLSFIATDVYRVEKFEIRKSME